MVTEKIYIKATSIEQAVTEANNYSQSFRFVAGGTDVIVNKFQQNDEAACLIDISEIEELKHVKTFENHIEIGALLRLDKLKNHKIIAHCFPILLQAAQSVASPVIRKTATLGGNLLCENRCIFYNQSEWWRQAAGNCLKCKGSICIATGGKKNCLSKFVSDTAIALISLNASVEIVENNKTSLIPLENIYTGDGVNPRQIGHTAILKSIHIPIQENSFSVFKKLRQRESIEFTSLSTAVTIDKYEKMKIVLGGVDPKPIVFEGTNEADKNELISQVIKKSRIAENDTFSKAYRKKMITVYLEQSFKELANKNK